MKESKPAVRRNAWTLMPMILKGFFFAILFTLLLAVPRAAAAGSQPDASLVSTTSESASDDTRTEEGQTGSLVICIDVPRDVAADVPFEFEVELEGDGLEDDYGPHSGPLVRKVEVRRNGPCIIPDLPIGTEYRVQPTGAVPLPDLELLTPNFYGVIWGTKPAEAVFKYQHPAAPVGGLTVTKTVAGKDDATDEFIFTVTLSESIEGEYGEMTFEKGSASFTLHNGESKTATGLPAGIEFTVKEYTPSGYSSNTPYIDIIPKDDIEPVEIINTWSKAETKTETGTLTIHKEVDGPDSVPNREFQFTVTLSDTSIQGEHGDLNFKDGVAAFSLHHGQTVSAEGLPAGTEYTVEEHEESYFRSQPTDATGQIKAGETAEAKFVNTPLGGLEIRLSAVDPLTPDVQEIRFPVQIALNPPVSAAYSGYTFKDGLCRLEMKDGEYIVLDGIPAGTTYTITEPDTKGFTTDYHNCDGTISVGTHPEAIIINHRSHTGSLTVTKQVDGPDFLADRSYSFRVVLDNKEISGPHGGMTFRDGEATFTLKAGETCEATGLPALVGYEVIEDVRADEFEVSSAGARGTIPIDGSASSVFTNRWIHHGNLEVVLHVEEASGAGQEDSRGNPSEAFSFRVVLDDPSVSGTYGGILFSEGVGTFQLRDDQSIVFQHLPAGTGFRIVPVEGNPAGYRETRTGDAGTIPSEDTAKAVILEVPEINPGSLVIRNFIDDRFPDADTELAFRVETSDRTLNGLYGSMTFVNGVAVFSLPNEGTISATGLPAGLEVSVTEDVREGKYHTEVSSRIQHYRGEILSETEAVASRSISCPIRDSAETTITFVNTRSIGGLNITKQVKGSDIDRKTPFHFRIFLNLPDGRYGDLIFKDGISEFTLKDGETVRATGLPSESEYRVVEDNVRNFTVFPDTGVLEGRVSGGSIVEAVFINTAPGSLMVRKDVTGTGADPESRFHFRIVLGQPLDGTFGDLSFTGGVCDFQLKGGESRTVSGIPAGTSFRVQEFEKAGYLSSSTGSEGTIQPGQTSVCTYVNQWTGLPPAEYGSIRVQKLVVGQAGDVLQHFRFRVELSQPLNGKYGALTLTDGSADFELRHGETMLIDHIPSGTGYRVTELDADQGGFVTYSSGSTGTVRQGQVSDVLYRNVRDTADRATGGITIHKILAGSDDKSLQFTFRIILSDKTISGRFGDLDFSSGMATFRLRPGESLTADGLPAGTTYLVEELNAEDYEVSSDGEKGVIPSDGTAASAVFVNRPKKTEEGSLQIAKVCTGKPEHAEQKFHFRVELGDSSVNGTYGDLLFVNGTSDFTLSDGQTVSADGLPSGTSYTVVEREADATGCHTRKEGDVGVIPSSGIAQVLFENIFDPLPETGSIRIQKFVQGTTADWDRDFHFRIELDDSSVNGVHGDLTFRDGVAVFELRHGESVLAEQLPAGVHFSVSETEANQDGYTTTLSSSSTTVRKDETVLVNVINSRRTGSLTVEKHVQGKEAQRAEEFLFLVVLSDSSLSGTYGEMHFSGGVAQVWLGDGQRKTATGLPAGITYNVLEAPKDGTDSYTSECITGNCSGEIVPDTTITVRYVNDFSVTPDNPGSPAVPGTPPTGPATPPQNPTPQPNGDPETPDIPENSPSTPKEPRVPQTGDTGASRFWLLILLSSLAAALSLLLPRKRNPRK